VVSRILSFRPAGVVGRLGPRSAACPLSLRDLLGPAADLGIALPLVRAPQPAVARGALVAAKGLRSALGLALPAGQPPEPWFDAVARAADELAAGLPIFLAAEVVVAGEAVTQIDQACREASRLVGAGLTHLALDAAAVSPPERGRILAEVARGADERGISVECVVPLDQGTASIRGGAALLEELAELGVTLDLVSVRCRGPADADEARLQVALLARLGAALAGVPVLRRGPCSPTLLGLVAGSPVRACEDGGMVARGVAAATSRGAAGGARRLGPAGAAQAAEALDRLEAGAWAGAGDFIEGLGSANSARALSRALEARLVDGTA
jgi:hypothetical protein